MDATLDDYGSIHVQSVNTLPVATQNPAVSGVLFLSLPQIDDFSDRPPCPDCPTCPGMPAWQVSQPYVSLWLQDEPLGYQPAVGPRVSFQLAYKQREFVAGWNNNFFSVGRNWNFQRSSYISCDSDSNKVVNLPGGGQRTFIWGCPR